MTWTLLRSNSFLTHSYILFSSRETGHRYSIVLQGRVIVLSYRSLPLTTFLFSRFSRPGLANQEIQEIITRRCHYHRPEINHMNWIYSYVVIQTGLYQQI